MGQKGVTDVGSLTSDQIAVTIVVGYAASRAVTVAVVAVPVVGQSSHAHVESGTRLPVPVFLAVQLVQTRVCKPFTHQSERLRPQTCSNQCCRSTDRIFETI